MSFEKWLLRKVAAKTSLNYSRAISGSISEWAIAAQLIDQPLSSIQDFEVFQALVPHIKALPTFQAFNKKGKGMYQAALNRYAAYLAQEYLTGAACDVLALLEQPLAETEKKTLISARIGQGTFRQSLFQHWQGCAVTGYNDPRFLVASHIKPWRLASNVERLDPYNGLLLLPNLDRAFDSGLISFTDTGKVMLSSFLSEPACLGISSDMQIKLQEPHLPYLHFHQERVFQGF